VSNVIRSLLVKIGADLSRMQKDLNAASKQFKTVGKELTETGRTLTMGLTLPIAAAAGASVKLASDLEETMNKVNVAFGDSADMVTNWAKTSVTKMGLAQQTALDMTATFGDMATSMGFTASEAAKLGTQITERAADLASFKNISIDIAQTALNGIFTGETESLKRMGVVMTEANLQLYAMEKGIKKSYKEMTQAEKVTLRYNYVMDMTKNSAGDFVRTQGGVANQSRIVQESLKELGATIGKIMIPATKDLLKNINLLLKGFVALPEEQKKTIMTMAAVVAAIGPALLVIGKLTTGIGAAIKSFSAFVGVIKGGGGFMAAMSAMIGPAGIVVLVTTAITALSVAMLSIGRDSREATRGMVDLANSVRDSSTAFKTQVTEIETESNIAKTLADKLYALAGKENLSNQEKVRMVSLVEQLNSLIPELNLTIDAQTGKLNKQRLEIASLIDARLQQLKLQANEERLVELYREQETLKNALTQAQFRYNRAVSEAGKPGFGAWNTADVFRELAEAKKALDALSISASGNAQSIASAERAYDSYYNTLSKKKLTGITEFKPAGPQLPSVVTSTGSGGYSSGGGGGAPSGNYTLNVNGATDPNQVAYFMAQQLRRAGVIA